MPSDQSTVDFIPNQIQDAGEVSAKKMFGEFCLYCDGKIVGGVNDNLFFVKITERGRAMLGDVSSTRGAEQFTDKLIGNMEEASPYPGAKPQLLIDKKLWNDREFMSKLVGITCAELPKPRAKK